MEVLSSMCMRLTSEIRRTLDEGAFTVSRIDSHITIAERLLRGLVIISGSLVAPQGQGTVDMMIRILQTVISTLMIVSGNLIDRQCRGTVGYSPEIVPTWQGSRGRPRINITRDMLFYFMDNGFSATATAMLLHVSLSTVRRRMNELGLRIRELYSDMTDVELDRLITVIQYEYPNSGYRMMQGHLLRLGHHVQQERVRSAMIRMDPEGVLSRWRQTVHRRHYSVPTSNSLWHVDGNHRLIRWRMVIHAGVDGYSRLAVYCHCSTNNLAATVLALFREAVNSFGLPSRVRCDRGCENVDISRYMLSHPLRGVGRSSIIVGRSVHNQRIERFWRDLFIGCTSIFYHLFYYLEDSGLLDPTSSIDLFCLHLVYQPYINHCLSTFVEAWNNHRLRSERNKTPKQLWIEGLLNNSRSGHTVTDELYMDSCHSQLDEFGIDWDEAIPLEVEDNAVVVPDTPCPCRESQLPSITAICSLQRVLSSDCHGVDIYLETLNYIRSHSVL